MSTRRSPVWNVFTESKENKGIAICNICSQEFSFRTTTTNLLKHVQRKHPEINIILNTSIHIEAQKSIGLPELLPKGIEIIIEDECDGNQPKEEPESFTEDNSNSTVDRYYENVSSMWLHFTKIETSSGFSAVCNVCDKKISYKTTSNLKKHLERIHPEHLEGDSYSSEEISMKCQFCLENFISRTDLQIHIQKYHPVQLPNKIQRQSSEKRSSVSGSDKESLDSEEEQFILNDSSEEFSNNQQNSSRTASCVWRFFTKISDSNLAACCNLCNRQLSYKTTTFNLKRHLKRKHPEVLTNTRHDPEQVFLIEEPFKQELEDNKIKSHEDNFDDDQYIQKYNFNVDMNTRRSQIWNVFTIHSMSDSIATCNVCNQQFSYKSTTNDLKRHFQRKHPDISMENKIEQVKVKIDAYESDTVPNVNSSETDDDQEFPNEKKLKKHSILWNYFTKSISDEYLATCNICKKKLCYKSTTTNLRKHLNSKHPHIQIHLTGDQDQNQVLQSEFPSSLTCDKNSDGSKKGKYYSAIWNYFTRNKPNEYLATCNVCGKELCYRTSITNLKKHISIMHVDIKIMMDEELSQNQVNINTEMLHIKTEIDQNDSDDDSSNYQESNNAKTRQYSVLWNYFIQSDPKKYIATCNICQRELRYRTTSNLKKHLIKVHPHIDINMEIHASKQLTDSQDTNENALDDFTSTIENTESSQPNIKKERRHYSKLWNHFTRKKTDECIASCNLCDKEIGYRTSTSNMKKHLISLHPDIDFQLETEIHQNQINLGAIKTCLICLQNNRYLPKIFFQISNSNFQEKSYVTKLGEILNEDIIIDESHVICQSCIDDIEKVYQFKQKITKSFDFWSKLESELEIETYKDISDPTNDRDQTELDSDSWVKFTCDRCHQEFESACTMLNHTCTTDDKVKYQVNVARKPIKLPCKYCGSVFNKKWKRDRHLKRCRNPVEKKFDCTVCEKSYKSAFLLREHMSTHTGERNYMCHFCGKTFHRASVRHKHLQSHNRKPGETIKRKSFLCFICGKTFPANVATRHMRMHSGVKRKECHICFKRFDQVAHLKVHLRTHSGERPYECRICSRRFSLAATLRKHMRLHVDTKEMMTDDIQQDLSIDTPIN